MTNDPKMPVSAAIIRARELLPDGYKLVLSVMGSGITVTLDTPTGIRRGDIMSLVTVQIQELVELAVREVER